MLSRNIIDDFRSIIDDTRSIIDDSRSIIDYSRSIIDDSRSIIDDSRCINDNYIVIRIILLRDAPSCAIILIIIEESFTIVTFL
jgi:hypothetical protein